MLTKKLLKDWSDALSVGKGVLTAGKVHDDIPTIHQVGPGSRIDTGARVEHQGFGSMKAGNFRFYAGGSMYDRDVCSWTPFYTITGESVGEVYDLEAAKAAVEELLASLGGEDEAREKLRTIRDGNVQWLANMNLHAPVDMLLKKVESQLNDALQLVEEAKECLGLER